MFPPARIKRPARAVSIGETAYGRGVFATRRFRGGETIAAIEGRVIADPDYGSSYCMDLGYGAALEPDPPFRFLNHSCRPNCAIGGYTAWDEESSHAEPVMYLTALTAIAPGEQLTIDYAWPASSAIPCLCGSDDCRGWIVAASKRDDLPAARQQGT